MVKFVSHGLQVQEQEQEEHLNALMKAHIGSI